MPYPTGTDRVADGDNAMQSLATRVDTVLTSELVQAKANYVELAGANSWVAPGRVAVRAGWVHLIFTATKAAWTAAETITNIPSGLRPYQNVYVAGVATSSGSYCPFLIQSGGSVQPVFGSATTGGGGINGAASWPIGLTGTAAARPTPELIFNNETEGNDDDGADPGADGRADARDDGDGDGDRT
jgi:hypothetical protein